MPISHQTKLYGFQDCKLYPVTADTAGGSITYGSGVDIPGVKTLELTGSVNSKSLRGDNQLLDQFSTLGDLSGKITHAKLSQDILAAVLGGSVVDAGSGTTETATWALTGASAPKYFKIEGRTPTDGVDTIGGDAHLIFAKCILTNFPAFGFAEEDYQNFTLEFGTIPALATGNAWMSVVLNETQVVVV